MKRKKTKRAVTVYEDATPAGPAHQFVSYAKSKLLPSRLGRSRGRDRFTPSAVT
jgi:hypothetical protein